MVHLDKSRRQQNVSSEYIMHKPICSKRITPDFRALLCQEKHLNSKIISFVVAVLSVTSDWIINLHSCLYRLGLQQTMVPCTLQISQPLIRDGLTMRQNEQHLQVKIALYSHLKVQYYCVRTKHYGLLLAQ